MMGYCLRYVQIIVRFLPFAFAYIRDRRRFILFGSSRRVSRDRHLRRAERLAEVCLDLGPTFIKVGQVLSTRPDIVSPTYAEVLEQLQDEVPEGAGGDTRPVVEDELGSQLDLSTLRPIAGGSLAHVYSVTHEGTELALKVRRPGIERVIERDISILRNLVPLIGILVEKRQRRSLENVVADFDSIIHDELDFEREATIMEEIRENVRDDIVVPSVHHDISSSRVIVMEYVEATKITDDDAFVGIEADPNDIAERIAVTYLRMGLVDGVFHADPHPGNVAIDDAGRLVLYDFGMSDRLSPTQQADIRELYRTLVFRDIDALISALIRLDVLDPAVDRVLLRHVLTQSIANLEGRTDITWRVIITEFLSDMRAISFHIPPDVMLLIRVGTVSEGVCRDLDPGFDFIDVIRRFLIDEGIVESEMAVLLEDMREDIRRSAPTFARIPYRLDAVLGQLERGELAIRAQTETQQSRLNRSLGIAVIAGSLIIGSTVLVAADRIVLAGMLALIALLFTTMYVRQIA